MKDENTELNTQPTPAEDERKEIPRREFFGNLAGAAAAIGAIGLTAKGQELNQAKEIKGRILSRIQQQLNQEPGAEGMEYIRSDLHTKGGSYGKGPAPIVPIAE